MIGKMRIDIALIKACGLVLLRSPLLLGAGMIQGVILSISFALVVSTFLGQVVSLEATWGWVWAALIVATAWTASAWLSDVVSVYLMRPLTILAFKRALGITATLGKVFQESLARKEGWKQRKDLHLGAEYFLSMKNVSLAQAQREVSAYGDLETLRVIAGPFVILTAGFLGIGAAVAWASQRWLFDFQVPLMTGLTLGSCVVFTWFAWWSLLADLLALVCFQYRVEGSVPLPFTRELMDEIWVVNPK